MSNRTLADMNLSDLAAFLETNGRPALEPVLGELLNRYTGRTRKLVAAISYAASLPGTAEQTREPAKRKPGRPRKAEPVASGERVVSTAVYVDPDDGSVDASDTPHMTVAALARDALPEGAVRRRAAKCKHYSNSHVSVGLSAEQRAGRAHDRRLAQAVTDVEALPVPEGVSWDDHVRDCAVRNGVSLRCSLLPALDEKTRKPVASLTEADQFAAIRQAERREIEEMRPLDVWEVRTYSMREDRLTILRYEILPRDATTDKPARPALGHNETCKVVREGLASALSKAA